MYATYSPDDDKLRIYPDTRLPKDTYLRVKGTGFTWAPKQELFVAVWTPEREDICIELCGEIGDEDTSLVERAEERAERFGEYAEKRETEAERAKEAVAAIADGIPLGQPILLAHHSEKRARKDAEKIKSGMQKAIRLWETSKYWTERAKGALSHAKYKEKPEVRHRRIKTLEAELRQCKSRYTPPDDPPHIINQTAIGESEPTPHVWVGPKGGRGGYWAKVSELPNIKARYERWERHLENRIAYEKAMLDEQGGVASDRFDIQVGGQALIEGSWLTILRINKSGGAISSVTTTSPAHVTWRNTWKFGIEKVKDYRPPTEELQQKTKAAMKQPPICNYQGFSSVPRFNHGEAETKAVVYRPITQAEWDKCDNDYKCTRVVEATEQFARHRVRCMVRGGEFTPVFITDAKEKLPPAPDGSPTVKVKDLPKETVERRMVYRKEEETVFDQMKDSLRAGIQTVSAPQLFPTPPDLARQLVALAGVSPSQRVLEPSAGTGNLCKAIIDACLGADCVRIVAVEANYRVAEQLVNVRNLTLYANDDNYRVIRKDFLECTPEELGTFHRIVMNPPFENGSDIKHIEHAMKFLKEGGQLAAICANGPRQRERLKPLADEWIDLPEGSFKQAGTNVNCAMLKMERSS